jgi:hypothetical protein
MKEEEEEKKKKSSLYILEISGDLGIWMSSWWPKLNPRSVIVGFMVEKVAIEIFFL